MAGRRHSKIPARPARYKAREARISGLLATGYTPEQRAAAAFDALRMAAAHSPERGPLALADAAAQMSALTAWVVKGGAP